MIYDAKPLFDAWRSLPREGLIRLALLDVDGCLTDGEAAPLDFPTFQRLQELNRLATTDPTIPGLALCTGRPEPYVELLTQAIGGYLPSIWENGAGLYFPVDYRFGLHPALDRERLEAYEQVRRLIYEALIAPGLARRQPGKEVSISLYPVARNTIESIYTIAARAIRPIADRYWVQSGLTCIEVLPEGIHKGSGVRWLLDEIGLDAAHTIGVGDAPGDLEILRVTALGATPANGAEDLKAAANFVASQPSSAGVLEILDWCIARNRA